MGEQLVGVIVGDGGGDGCFEIGFGFHGRRRLSQESSLMGIS